MPKTSPTQAFADQLGVTATLGRHLPEFAKTYGVELAPLAQALSINPDTFNHLHERISLDRFCRLLDLLATTTRDDCFGLKYGQFYRIGGSGPFGYGLASAPSFKDALRFLAKYLVTIADLDILNLYADERRVVIQWSVSPLVMNPDQFYDFAASIIMRQLDGVAGSVIRPVHANFIRPAPRDKALHFKHFSNRISFDAKCNEVELPGSLLGGTNTDGDEVLFEVMSQQCEEIASLFKTGKSIITRVKDDVARHLAKGDTSIRSVAGRLALSERTLQRRLTEAGGTFNALSVETRSELSLRLLTETDLPLAEISHRLGYSAPSAYTRAASRWHGKAPHLLRK